MTMNRLIWFKGDIVQAADAKVSALSPTAQFGLNVFEGVRGYQAADGSGLLLFRLDDHLDRLFQSCRLLEIICPYGREFIKQKIEETLRANEFSKDVALRVTVFVDGEGSWSSSTPVDMFIAPIEREVSTSESWVGKSACVSTWERISDRSFPPRVKAGANYINGRYALLEATRNGYDLPILLDAHGKVTESSGACLFMVRNGELVTPPVSSSILESITRETVLDIATRMNVGVELRPIDRTELYIAEEVFLCGSAAEITPILSIDGFALQSGAPDALTLQIRDHYLTLVRDVREQSSTLVTLRIEPGH